jgi:hypothetical protein
VQLAVVPVRAYCTRLVHRGRELPMTDRVSDRMPPDIADRDTEPTPPLRGFAVVVPAVSAVRRCLW